MPSRTTAAPAALAGADDLREVFADLGDRQAAQAIVRAELDDDERGLVVGE